ncbi:MAG: hypothetical protein PHG00_02735 [Methylococcales bacterium]|nr:hypothetical protein [Methylococcales bacterium]
MSDLGAILAIDSVLVKAVKVIDASGIKIHWEEAYADMAAFEKFGSRLPDENQLLFSRARQSPDIDP